MSADATKVTRLSIGRKLLGVSFILLLIPIIALGSVSCIVASKETNALIEKSLKNNVKMAIEMINSLDASVKNGMMTQEEAQENLRVLLLGQKQDGKRPINKEIDLGPNGYFFILNDKGDLLAHPSLEGQNIWDKKTSDGTYYIQDMIKKAKMGGGFTYYNWPLPNSAKEALKVSYAEVSPSWKWIVAAGSYMQDYNAGQKHIFTAIVITLVICLAVGLTILALFARHISKPIRLMTHEAQQIAQGDLRASDLKVKNRDEIGQLAASFNLMNHNLKQVVLGLASSSDSLSEASQQLSAAINETKEAANQISVSIQGTAANNDTQARSIREISRAMEEMTDGIQRIAATSSTAYEASAGTLDEAERGNELILLATEQMNAVSVTVGDLRTVIDKLGERSQQIGEIVQVITEISAQTHLLALNASIEAAQAGEHGKGFAVVASEIRKLAERSNQSAEQVAGLIEAIQTDIGNTIKTMHKGEEEVEAGVNGIHETGKALVRILNATRSVVDQVQEASAAAEEMSASSQQIAASLLEMERVSTQTANAAQEITAATEEQLASMEEIASSADTLSQMSEEMKQVVYKFKI